MKLIAAFRSLAKAAKRQWLSHKDIHISCGGPQTDLFSWTFLDFVHFSYSKKKKKHSDSRPAAEPVPGQNGMEASSGPSPVTGVWVFVGQNRVCRSASSLTLRPWSRKVLKHLLRFNGRLVGLFQHCTRRLIVLLPPSEFLHSYLEAPRTTQGRETSASEGRNYYQGS